MAASRRAAIVLLTFLFICNVYRAFTQSVVCDEAFSWQVYLSRPLPVLFSEFTAANHLIATLLAWVSLHSLRPPGFAMRVPTLLGGAWYFVNVYRLCSRLFVVPFRFFLGVSLLTLNPLILDMLVAARGYGLALAGLSFTLLAMVDYLSGHERLSLYKTRFGICFAIGSSLTFLVPCAALILIFSILCVEGGSIRSRILATLRFAALLAAPVLAFFVALYLVFPLHKAQPSDFLWGVNTWQESARNLIRVCFCHNCYIGSPEKLSIAYQIWMNFMTAATIVLLLLLLVRLVWLISRRNAFSAEGTVFLLTTGTIFLSAAALFTVHAALRVLYPVDRLGLYFLALMPLAVLTSIPQWERLYACGCLFLASVAALAFAWQFETRFFYVWRYDADTERILRMINDRASKENKPVRLGISWPLEPSVNFYRAVDKYSWLAPVDRKGPFGDYDYYIVTPPMKDILLDDEALFRGQKLTILYRGPVSGARLAIKAPN